MEQSVELTVPFPDTALRGLEVWAWLPHPPLRPFVCSLFGDVILKGDNEWWFLDTVEGTLTVEWPHWDAVERSLETEEGQDRYLLGGLAVGAASRCMVLPRGTVGTFIPHPVMGGDFNLERVMAVDIRGRNPATAMHSLQGPPTLTVPGWSLL